MFLKELATHNIKKIASGVFGADMTVKIDNDGPITLIADTDIMRKRHIGG